MSHHTFSSSRHHQSHCRLSCERDAIYIAHKKKKKIHSKKNT